VPVLGPIDRTSVADVALLTVWLVIETPATPEIEKVVAPPEPAIQPAGLRRQSRLVIHRAADAP